VSGFPPSSPTFYTNSGLFVVGQTDGIVYDSGKTNNTSVLNSLATTAQNKGYGDMWVLADPSGAGNYIGCDWDIPSMLCVHGTGPTLMKNPGSTIPLSGGYNGTAFGPCIGGAGVLGVTLGPPPRVGPG
jgi:hypothetical protein